MKKKIISLLLIFATLVSVITVVSVSSAAASTATIIVDGKSYTASVGDEVVYTLSLGYSKSKVSSAQIELPVDFTVLSGYTTTELNNNASKAFPAVSDTAYAVRYDSKNSFGLVGYVVNFASVTGYDFSSSKAVLTIPFKVLKAGTVTLKSDLRYVSDVNDQDIIDGSYSVKDSSFKATETLKVDSKKVTISGKAESFLDANGTVTFTLKESGMTVSETSFIGNSFDYNISADANKTYTLTVSKLNHADRDYTIKVSSSAVTQDVKICPMGDANLDGKVRITDVNVMYKHVLGQKMVTDPYAIKCADIKGNDNLIKISDVNALYKHVLGTKKLY